MDCTLYDVFNDFAEYEKWSRKNTRLLKILHLHTNFIIMQKSISHTTEAPPCVSTAHQGLEPDLHLSSDSTDDFAFPIHLTGCRRRIDDRDKPFDQLAEMRDKRSFAEPLARPSVFLRPAQYFLAALNQMWNSI